MQWIGREDLFHRRGRALPAFLTLVFLSLPSWGLAQEKTPLFIDEVRFKGFGENGNSPVPSWGPALAAELSGFLGGSADYTPMTLENLVAQLGKERLKETLACKDSVCISRIVENFGCSESVFVTVNSISTSKVQVTLVHSRDGTKVSEAIPLYTPPTYDKIALAIRKMAEEIFEIGWAGGSLDERRVDQLESKRGRTGSTGSLSEVQLMTFLLSSPPRASLVVKGMGSRELASGKPETYVLPSGRITYRVVADGFHPHVETVELMQGSSLTRKIELVALEKAKKDDCPTEGMGFLEVFGADIEYQDADIWIDGEDVRKTTDVLLEQPGGWHMVVARKRLYKDFQKRVCVTAKLRVEVPVRMEPDYGTLKIESVPPGARVYVDGIETGQAPLALERMASKAYRVRLEMGLYESVEEVVYVPGGGTGENKEQKLSPVHGFLKVVSRDDQKRVIKGADVVLDGNKVGETPWVSGPLPLRSYTVEVSEPHHRKWKGDVQIVRGRNTLKTAVLEAEYAIVDVRSTPLGARVYVDDRFLGETPLKSLKVPAGNPTFKIHLDDAHHQYEETIAIAVREKKQINPQLKPKTGTVTIFTEPRGAAIYVDGEKQKGRTTLDLTLPIGTHELRVVKEGYIPEIRNVRVELDEALPLELSLTQNTVKEPESKDGGLFIVADCSPKGSLLFLNGVAAGRSPMVIPVETYGLYELLCVGQDQKKLEQIAFFSGTDRYVSIDLGSAGTDSGSGTLFGDNAGVKKKKRTSSNRSASSNEGFRRYFPLAMGIALFAGSIAGAVVMIKSAKCGGETCENEGLSTGGTLLALGGVGLLVGIPAIWPPNRQLSTAYPPPSESPAVKVLPALMFLDDGMGAGLTTTF